MFRPLTGPSAAVGWAPKRETAGAMPQAQESNRKRRTNDIVTFSIIAHVFAAKFSQRTKLAAPSWLFAPPTLSFLKTIPALRFAIVLSFPRAKIVHGFFG